MAFLRLGLLSVGTCLLGRRDALRLNGEGWGTLAATFLAASLRAAITRQSPVDIAWFLAFSQAVFVVVTRAHPKRVLPHQFLDFRGDEALQAKHEGQEEVYGWVAGLIIVAVVIYVIFTSPTPD